MNELNTAFIGLLSASLVVILKGLFDYIMDRRRRKDKLEDDKTGKDEEILAAIGEIKKELASIKYDIQTVREEGEEGRIVECRIRILRFSDEILHGAIHSKDHFDQILIDIGKYEKYCDGHPRFENGITKSSISMIKDTYTDRLKKNDFL